MAQDPTLRFKGQNCDVVLDKDSLHYLVSRLGIWAKPVEPRCSYPLSDKSQMVIWPKVCVP